MQWVSDFPLSKMSKWFHFKLWPVEIRTFGLSDCSVHRPLTVWNHNWVEMWIPFSGRLGSLTWINLSMGHFSRHWSDATNKITCVKSQRKDRRTNVFKVKNGCLGQTLPPQKMSCANDTHQQKALVYRTELSKYNQILKVLVIFTFLISKLSTVP